MQMEYSFCIVLWQCECVCEPGCIKQRLWLIFASFSPTSVSGKCVNLASVAYEINIYTKISYLTRDLWSTVVRSTVYKAVCLWRCVNHVKKIWIMFFLKMVSIVRIWYLIEITEFIKIEHIFSRVQLIVELSNAADLVNLTAWKTWF